MSSENCEIDADIVESSTCRKLSSEVVAPLTNIKWRDITSEGLNLQYSVLFNKRVADKIFRQLEEEIEYFVGDLARVKVFGKWHELPRKQSSYGDAGLEYKYSGVVTPAQTWTPTLLALRECLQRETGVYYNFVLVNRYKDGKDKMGEHKDDEKDLSPNSSIASLSFGCERPFYFVHQDVKRKKRDVEKVTLSLEHGSLLVMKPPTNTYWYHALPPRTKLGQTRINLTFRCIEKTAQQNRSKKMRTK